ncbi:D-alanyl-D-alanine carboxypeptidase family protein [Bradyrhizobium sp. LHD-71]|uniref:D-alanyl-D-alanine carboxypeptidase family protein n=1 Tax=Bradyrhizobium sp. LHD-71 TaxID=3072141 RepID=UPI00280C4DBB|nr:D-alanyl-D-alanine carboxypeptidase family protein [Bradyrhizobium sp. LHD-71]MDQ8730668.1 D-alanyl-D-alanine carboxypeptidase family protein [Bradyrhizobium sp. LHD-71]
MHHLPASHRFSSFRFVALAVIACAAVVALAQPARSEALIVVEADSGRVIYQENATYPWHPASVTKLMTMYVALKAVKEGRMQLDTLLTVSPTAAAQAPSKMGFKAGTTVTLENALAMMMVKSANDMAVVIAEGVGGSIEKFADEMNRTALRLGMTQTTYVNPNGLPADAQITSARDMAMLARAIIRDLPEYEYFAQIPAIKFGRRVTRNFNSLIGRYPGADGMKTGFICASGFNLVASATRNGKRMIAVVLGAPSSPVRAAKAAQLLERGFSKTSGLSWLTPSHGTLASMEPVLADPPNLRDDMCGPKRKRPGIQSDDDHVEIAAGTNGTSENGDGNFSLFSAGASASLKPSEMLALPAAAAEPMVVYTGPKRSGAALVAAVAADEASQTPPAKKGKKKGVTAKIAVKPDAAGAKPDAKPAAKSATPSKPAAQKQAAKNPAEPKPVQAKGTKETVKDAAKGGAKAEAKASAAAKPAAAAAPAAAKPKPAAKDAKN